MAKGLKLEVRMFQRLIFTFVEVPDGNTGWERELFAPRPTLNRINNINNKYLMTNTIFFDKWLLCTKIVLKRFAVPADSVIPVFFQEENDQQSFYYTFLGLVYL